MIKAKLSAFLMEKDKVNRLYPATDRSAPARYAHAITAFRYGNINQALHLIDSLIAEQPNNPYFYDKKNVFENLLYI